MWPILFLMVTFKQTFLEPESVKNVLGPGSSKTNKPNKQTKFRTSLGEINSKQVTSPQKRSEMNSSDEM